VKVDEALYEAPYPLVLTLLLDAQFLDFGLAWRHTRAAMTPVADLVLNEDSLRRSCFYETQDIVELGHHCQ
jgi:hypothetical protein